MEREYFEFIEGQGDMFRSPKPFASATASPSLDPEGGVWREEPAPLHHGRGIAARTPASQG